MRHVPPEVPLKIQILCTLGPASMRPEIIRELDARNVDLFRINLSHTPLERVEPAIELIQGCSSTPICLDTEGAQVRCGEVADGVVLEEGSEIELVADRVVGSTASVTLWPATLFEALTVGSLLEIDFDGARLRVTDVAERRARAQVTSTGRMRSNKGVTVAPPPELPALSEKDEAAIELGARHGIADYALSFASNADEVARIRSLAPQGANVIAKIESRVGVRNMDAIIDAADAVLIDRGDLSREVPFELVPYYQKTIIRHANRWNRPVYVATNLLESMVTSRVPTIAESNDIANTLLDGVHGLVLAAETAVGIDPVASVDMVLRGIGAFERSTQIRLEDDELELPAQ
jgi:pyruvate kinase